MGQAIPSWDAAIVHEADAASPTEPLGDGEGGGSAPNTGWAEFDRAKKIGVPANGRLLFSVAGATFGIVVGQQLMTYLSCGEVSCGQRGLFARGGAVLAVSLSLAGGWQHGEHAAWKEAAAEGVGRPLKSKKIVGWTMFALGVGTMAMDAVFTGLCWNRAKGPWVRMESEFKYACKTGASAVLIDVGAVAASFGGAMAMSATRHVQAREKLKLSSTPGWGPAPLLLRGGAGLSVVGRFR